MSDQRERFLQSAARSYTDVPTCCGPFRIQTISVAEDRAIRMSIIDDEGEIDATKRNQLDCRYIQACAVEEDGTKTFVESEIVDMMAANAGLARQLVAAIEKHCGIGDEAPEIEELEKNSEATGSVSLHTA